MDRKRFYLIGIVLVSSAFLSIAEVPAGYYDSAVGKSGNALQKALSNLIGDRELEYNPHEITLIAIGPLTNVAVILARAIVTIASTRYRKAG